MTYFETKLATCPVIAILRGLSPEDADTAARRLWDIGVELVEITVQDSDGVRALERVSRSAEAEEKAIGAGSVTSIATFEQAVETGASFVISPGLDINLVKHAREAQIPYLPAVATPSEIQRAQEHDVRELKLFPARQLGGVGFLKAVAGPFPDVRFVATGGITVSDIETYLEAGGLGLGIGSELTQSAGIEALRGWLDNRRTAP